MIGFVKFDIKNYDARLDEHMKSPSNWVQPFELLCRYWSDLSANYKKNKIESDVSSIDEDFELELKVYNFFIFYTKCYLLIKLFIFNLENREYKSYIQDLLQLEYVDDFRTTGHEFYSLLINLPVDWAKVIIKFLAKDEKSYVYNKLFAAFEGKNEGEFKSLLENIDITQCSKFLGYISVVQEIYNSAKIMEMIDYDEDDGNIDNQMYELSFVNHNLILPHIYHNFGSESSEVHLLNDMDEMISDDEEDIENDFKDNRKVRLISIYYNWLLDATKELSLMTPKEKEWIRRIDSIPVIEEFDNTLVVGKSGNTGMIDELENTPVVEVLDSNQCPVEPQVDSEDKSTIKEHLPLPKYFDCEKLKRLHSAVYNYIDQDEKYFTFVFGGFGDKPNEGHKIQWKGENWEFAYFLKVLYAWEPELDEFHDAPFSWDVVQRIFISKKGKEMKSLKTSSKVALEKGHEKTCRRIKEVVKNIIYPI